MLQIHSGSWASVFTSGGERAPGKGAPGQTGVPESGCVQSSCLHLLLKRRLQQHPHLSLSVSISAQVFPESLPYAQHHVVQEDPKPHPQGLQVQAKYTCPGQTFLSLVHLECGRERSPEETLVCALGLRILIFSLPTCMFGILSEKVFLFLSFFKCRTVENASSGELNSILIYKHSSVGHKISTLSPNNFSPPPLFPSYDSHPAYDLSSDPDHTSERWAAIFSCLLVISTRGFAQILTNFTLSPTSVPTARFLLNPRV